MFKKLIQFFLIVKNLSVVFVQLLNKHIRSFYNVYVKAFSEYWIKSNIQKKNVKKPLKIKVVFGRFFLLNDKHLLDVHRSEQNKQEAKNSKLSKGLGFEFVLPYIIYFFTIVGVFIIVYFAFEAYIVDLFFPDFVCHEVRGAFNRDLVAEFSGALADGNLIRGWTAGHWLYSAPLFFKRRHPGIFYARLMTFIRRTRVSKAKIYSVRRHWFKRLFFFSRKKRFHHGRRFHTEYLAKRSYNYNESHYHYMKYFDVWRWQKRKDYIQKLKTYVSRSPLKVLINFKGFEANHGIFPRAWVRYVRAHFYDKTKKGRRIFKVFPKTRKYTGLYRALYGYRFRRVLGFPPIFFSPYTKRLYVQYYKFCIWWRDTREYWGDGIFVLKDLTTPRGVPYRKSFQKLILFLKTYFGFIFELGKALDYFFLKLFPSLGKFIGYDGESELDAFVELLVMGSDALIREMIYPWAIGWLWLIANVIFIIEIYEIYMELFDHEDRFDELWTFVGWVFAFFILYNYLLVMFYFQYFDEYIVP